MTNTKKDILQETRNPDKSNIRYRKRKQEEHEDQKYLEEELERIEKEKDSD